MVAMAESPVRTGRSCRAVASVYGSYIDEPLCMVKANGERFFYSTNDLYSVYALTDSDGEVVERYVYDPYGAVTVMDGNGTPREGNQSLYGNPFTWEGRRLDSETGLMYFRLRMYDVGLGRFSKRDPLGYQGVGTTPPEMPLEHAFVSDRDMSIIPDDLSAPEELSLYSFGGAGPASFLDPSGGCSGRDSKGKLLNAGFPAPTTKPDGKPLPGICNCFDLRQTVRFGNAIGGAGVGAGDNLQYLYQGQVVGVGGRQVLNVRFTHIMDSYGNLRMKNPLPKNNVPDCACIELQAVMFDAFGPDGVSIDRAGAQQKRQTNAHFIGQSGFQFGEKTDSGQTASLKPGNYQVRVEITYVLNNKSISEYCWGAPIPVR